MSTAVIQSVRDRLVLVAKIWPSLETSSHPSVKARGKGGSYSWHWCSAAKTLIKVTVQDFWGPEQAELKHHKHPSHMPIKTYM